LTQLHALLAADHPSYVLKLQRYWEMESLLRRLMVRIEIEIVTVQSWVCQGG
jgi:hypothetical protein